MTREEILAVAKPILFNTDMVRAILEGRKSVTRRVIKLKYDNTHHEMRTDKYGTRLIEIENEMPGVTSGKNEDGTTWTKLRGYIEPKAPYKRDNYLYIRETWSEWTDGYVYKAWTEPFPQPGRYPDEFMTWHPSIHMPKDAARIFLRVKDVRVERLQNIAKEQAINEGISRLYDDLPDEEYCEWTNRVHIDKQKSDWGWKNYLWHGLYGTCGTGNRMSDAWEFQGSSYDDPIGSFSSLWNSTLPLKQWDKYGWDANPWVWVIEFERVEVSDESISV